MAIDPQTQRALRDITRDLASMKQGLKNVSRKPQLPNSSIDVGALNVRGGKIQTWQTNSEGVEYVSTALGGSDPQSFQIFDDPDDGPTFSVTPEGAMSTVDLSVQDDPVVAGVPVMGSMLNPGTVGWMDQMPRGTVNPVSFRDLVDGVVIEDGAPTTPIGYFKVILYPNRRYQLTMPWRSYIAYTDVNLKVVNITVRFWMTYSDSVSAEPATPTTQDTAVVGQSETFPSMGTGIADTITGYFTTPDPADGKPFACKFLLGIWANYGKATLSTGTGDASNVSPVSLWTADIEDTGPVQPMIKASAGPSGATQRYVTTWAATDSAVYDAATGKIRSGPGIDKIGDAEMWQGTGAINDITNFSAFVCDGTAIDGEDATMDVALSTAKTIEKVEVGLQVVWSETTPCEVLAYWLDRISLPTTLHASPDGQKHMRFSTGSQWVWFTVDPSEMGGFDPTSTRGMLLGASGSGQSAKYHLHVAGASSKHPPLIRVTYTR